MIELVPYERKYLLPLLEQHKNFFIKDLFMSGAAKDLEGPNSGAYSLLFNGVPACCGGIMKLWEGRGQIWSVFNEDFKSNFVPIFRGIKRYLADQQKIYRRIEVAIPHDLLFAKRRIEMLGFKLECERAKSFLPDGQDCSLYALVRE